jgi:hypothetical protein
MRLTLFEEEVLDSILWQLEGYQTGKVSERATKRILRATLRRIRPKLVARSCKVVDGAAAEVDHAVPVKLVVERAMSRSDLSRDNLKDLICRLLVAVELSKEEHQNVLKKFRLQSSMPKDWDGNNPFARYEASGIKIVTC